MPELLLKMLEKLESEDSEKPEDIAVCKAADILLNHALPKLRYIRNDNSYTEEIIEDMRTFTAACKGTIFESVANEIAADFQDLAGSNAYLDRLLHDAFKYGRTDFVTGLLKCGVSINGKRDPATDQHVFVALRNRDCMRSFSTAIKYGLDINARDTSNRETYLHYAVRFHRVHTLKTLLAQGACNVNAVDNLGRTPLALAMSMLDGPGAGCAELMADNRKTIDIIEALFAEDSVAKDCYIPGDVHFAQESFPLLYLAVRHFPERNKLFALLLPLLSKKQINQCNSRGCCALMPLCGNQHESNVEPFTLMLRCKSTDVNNNGKGKNVRPIFYAVASPAKFECLLKNPRIDLAKPSLRYPLENVFDAFGREVWQLATYLCSNTRGVGGRGSLLLVQLLARRPNVDISVARLRALELAVADRRYDLLILLMLHGCMPLATRDITLPCPYEMAVADSNFDPEILTWMHDMAYMHPVVRAGSVARFQRPEAKQWQEDAVAEIGYLLATNEPSWSVKAEVACKQHGKGNAFLDSIRYGWRPYKQQHNMHHLKFRQAVWVVMHICVRLQTMPAEMWHCVLQFLSRSDFSDTVHYVDDDSEVDGSDDEDDSDE